MVTLAALTFPMTASAQTFCNPDRSDTRLYLSQVLDHPAFGPRRAEFGISGVTSAQIQVLYPQRIPDDILDARSEPQTSAAAEPSQDVEAVCRALTYRIVPDPQILEDQGDAYVFYKVGSYYFALSYFLPRDGYITFGLYDFHIFDSQMDNMRGWSH